MSETEAVELASKVRAECDAFLSGADVLTYASEQLVTALSDLLAWAERYRGGDESLHVEEWYIARDYARIALSSLPSGPLTPEPEQERNSE